MNAAVKGRLLVLASDVSSTGGIEIVARQVIAAAVDRLGTDGVRLVTVHPAPGGRLEGVRVRSVRQHRQDAERVPLSRQAAFVALALDQARRDRRTLAGIVCLHVGLAGVARAASLLAAAPYAVAAYGVEVWGDLAPWDAAALRRASAVWSISSFTSNRLRNRHKVPAHLLQAWTIGLSSDAPVSRETVNEIPTVLTVSRLTKSDAYKGVDVLLLAWPEVRRQVPGARLVVVGDGDQADDLQRLAELLGVASSVSFLGRVSDENRDEAYATADVFALPGRASFDPPQGEGFGLVFLEAQAAGLPVIAGRGGGSPEALVDGETGLLVDGEDPQDVANAVVRLLTDSELRATMRTAGSAWVERERSSQQARMSLDAMLEDLIGSG